VPGDVLGVANLLFNGRHKTSAQDTPAKSRSLTERTRNIAPAGAMEMALSCATAVVREGHCQGILAS
jgi:hypothetical protein